MARLPGSDPITFTLSASGISAALVCDDVDHTFIIEDLTREEQSPIRLQTSIDSTSYAEPIIVKNATNSPVQIAITGTGCGFPAALYLGPEDNYLSNIFQRLNIDTYKVSGAASSPSAVTSLIPVFNDHRKRLDQYELFKEKVQRKISYQLLLSLAAETFPYLTSTGLSVSTTGYSLTNVLLSNYSQGVIHLNRVTGQALSYGWEAELRVITITSR